MRATTITLAGKQYTVNRMPAMRAVAWRKKAQELLDAFPALADLYEQETENLVKASVELYRASSGVVEMLIDVVLAADPILDSDKTFVLENAYEDEFLGGFQSLMILNAPLSGMAQ